MLPKTHPSYGTVQFNLCHASGKVNLFGSPITNHSTIVSLIIREAEIEHELYRDRIFGNKRIIEVVLSAAQFAELLTTMNTGTGVPCTISHKDGKIIEDPPIEEIEIDRIKESFTNNVKQLRENLKNKSEELETLLEKKGFTKKDKKEISSIISKVRMEVENNWHFAIDQFNEAAERIVTASKAEVDSFVTNVIRTTGIKALKEAIKPTEQKALTEGE